MKVKMFEVDGGMSTYEYCGSVVIDSERFGPLPEFATYHYSEKSGKRVHYSQGVGERKGGLPKGSTYVV